MGAVMEREYEIWRHSRVTMWCLDKKCGSGKKSQRMWRDGIDEQLPLKDIKQSCSNIIKHGLSRIII
jgi:hypothetical protein